MEILFQEDSSVTMSSNTDVSLSSYDEDQGSKLIRKAREAPFVPIGRLDFDVLIMLYCRSVINLLINHLFSNIFSNVEIC